MFQNESSNPRIAPVVVSRAGQADARVLSPSEAKMIDDYRALVHEIDRRAARIFLDSLAEHRGVRHRHDGGLKGGA